MKLYEVEEHTCDLIEALILIPKDSDDFTSRCLACRSAATIQQCRLFVVQSIQDFPQISPMVPTWKRQTSGKALRQGYLLRQPKLHVFDVCGYGMLKHDNALFASEIIPTFRLQYEALI